MTGTQSDFDRIFDLCLERLQGGAESLSTILGDYPDMADELRPLLEASAWLFEAKSALDPRPSFVAVSRKSLVTRIQAEQAHGSASVQEPTQKGFLGRLWGLLTASTRTQPQRLAFQLAFAIIIVFGLIIGTNGLASLARSTQPGDALYPAKIAFEQLKLALTFDAESDIRLHMEFAQLRSEEMQSLVDSNQFTYLRDVLANYRYHMDESLRLLALLSEQDPEAARALAVEGYHVVFEGPRVLQGLAQSVPEQIFSGFGPALDEAQAWVDVMMGILDDLDVEIEPLPIPGEVQMPTRTPVPTPTTPPPETEPSGAVSTPTTTPTPTMTATRIPTSTPTPTSPSGWVPTSTSTQRPNPPRATNTPVHTPTSTLISSPTATSKFSTPSATIPPPTATATSLPPPTATATSLPPPTATVTSLPPPTATATSPPPPTPTSTEPPYPY